MSDTLFSHPLALLVAVGLPVIGIAARLLGKSFAQIAKWFLYISVFAVVVVMDSIFFPFIGGKDWFFRYAVELSLISAILWWAFEAKTGEVGKAVREMFRRPIVVAVSIFALVVLLSSFFAYDFTAAFWSNYERGESAFQMLHYLAFFLLSILFLKTEDDWKRIFGCSVVAAALMVGYGILGNFGATTIIGPYAGGGAPAGWLAKLTIGRFQGSLGNPAYVAPYLIFSIFFAAYLWIVNRKSSMFGAIRHWGYGILIAIFFLFFILSQTRGAFLGLGAGILVFLIYLVFSKNRAVRKVSLSVLAILIILGAGGFAVRNQAWVTNIPAGRLLQISTSDSTAQTRFWVWDEAWKGFLERPILGWGPENFTTVFDQQFNPNFYVPGVQTETWFDRAHSVFFDYLAETGLLGLLSYLAIFVCFYVCFVKFERRRNRKGDNDVVSVVERGLMVSLPVAYLIQGVAIFDVLPMYLVLFLFFGFSAFYFENKKS
jgi:O-antigen ligase